MWFLCMWYVRLLVIEFIHKHDDDDADDGRGEDQVEPPVSHVAQIFLCRDTTAISYANYNIFIVPFPVSASVTNS